LTLFGKFRIYFESQQLFLNKYLGGGWAWSLHFVRLLMSARWSFRVTPNVWRLCEEADFGELNCQHSTKVDAR